MKKSKPELSIIVPCYNEAKNIPLILERFAEVIDKGNRKKNDASIELILVNNGSKDDSAESLEKELKNPKYKFARTVLVKTNQGYGYGIMSGLRKAKGEFLSYTHADMQCDPKDVLEAFYKIQKSKNPKETFVKGKRIGRVSILSFCFLLLADILFLKNFKDINAQPKVFHHSLLTKLENPPNGFPLDHYIQYIALKNKMEIIEVPVKFGERKHGQSSWAHSLSSRIKTSWIFIRYLFKLRMSEPIKS